MSEPKFKSDAEYNAWLDAVMTAIGKLEPPFGFVGTPIETAVTVADLVLKALQERTPESPFSDSSRHEQYSRHLPNIDRLPAGLANAISNALQGVPGMLGAAWYGSRPEDLSNHTAIVRDVIASYLGANETVVESDESDDDTAFVLTDKGREAVEQAALDKATQQAPLTKRLIAALSRLIARNRDRAHYLNQHRQSTRVD